VTVILKMTVTCGCERMLALHKSLNSAHNPPLTGLTQEADRLTREVESVAKSIDGLVHGLSPVGMIYGLTEDEIKIVESEK